MASMGWLGRQDLEDREHHWLSRWATLSDACGGRRRDEAPDPMRTSFQRDRDRIIHCTAFRRLQHKTQVMAAFEGDHFRSRMTHSLEVAQLARGTAGALRLNPDLAEAIALAHDLGHPPFGHVGERELDGLMADHGGFRHNAQGARIVDCLEDRYGHGYGLNLTLALRRSLLKGRIPDGFPLSPDLRPRAQPPLEADLVDQCDKIAYLCHDLDDGLRAGAFATADVADLRLWQTAKGHAASPATGPVISEMIATMVHDLVAHSASAMEAMDGAPRIGHSDSMRVVAEELQRFLRDRFYRARLVLDHMEQGAEKIRAVFERLQHNTDELPEPVRDRIDRDGQQRVVCDYVAGMTDRYLLRQPG